jgi:hypothetical protein
VVLLLGCATYAVSATQNIPNYSSLIGDGRECSVLNWTGTVSGTLLNIGPAVSSVMVKNLKITTGQAGTTKGINVAYGVDITLQDLLVTGASASTGFHVGINITGDGVSNVSNNVVVLNTRVVLFSGTGIAVDHAIQTHLTNVEIVSEEDNISYNGLLLDAGVSGFFAESVSVTFGLHGMVIQDTDRGGAGNAPTALFFSKTLADTTSGGDAIVFDSTLGTSYLDAQFTESWAAGAGRSASNTQITAGAVGVRISGGRHIFFNGGVYRANDADGFKIDDADVRDVWIQGASITANNQGNAPDAHGIYISAAATNVSILNNNIANLPSGNMKYGVRVSAVNADELAIIGNDVTLLGIGGITNASTGDFVEAFNKPNAEVRTTGAGPIDIGFDYAGTSTLYKQFRAPHAAENVPSQFNLGMADGGFAGMILKNVRDGGFNSQSLELHTAHGGVSAGAKVLIDKSGLTTFNNNIAFEGSTPDANKTTVSVTDPTAPRSFTLPNADSVAIQPLTCSGTDKVSAVSSAGVITCSPDQNSGGGGGGGDNLRVEDGDNAGTFTAMNDADFDDSGDIDFQRTAGSPDSIIGVVRPNSVALTTDTTGNYVGSVADGVGIDGTASGEGATYTPTLDLTEINSHTFGDNTTATLVQTFDPSGASNPAWSYSNGAANLSTGTLQQAGTAVALQSVSLTAGSGLTGGGDLSANRTFDVAVTSPIEISGDTVACSTCSTAGNTQTFTNKTIDTEGTGNTLLLPQKIEFQAAGCDGSTASAAFDLPTSSAPAKSCQGTSPHRFGTLDFADGSALTSSVRFLLPSDWTSTGGIDIKFIWSSGSTSTNSVVWTVQTACVADGEDTANPTYNSAQNVSDANNATANTRNSVSQTSITITGCAAGETLYMKLGRDPNNGSDTLAATALLHSVELTIRRQI